ncbi:hypothetical protein OROGR_004444 [Orobanche gracilis]
MAEEDRPTETTSLFPAYVHLQPPQALPSDTNTASDTPQWLQSTSFTTDLSVVNDAVSKYNIPNFEEQEVTEEDTVEEINTSIRRPHYDMVPSSPSDANASSSGEENRKKRKKKKRRRMGEASGSYASYNSYAATISSSSRKRGVKKWAAASTNSNEKDYYFDSRGDRDNLALGCIYRMDGVGRLEGDSNIDALDTKLRSDGRYWSTKYAAIERHKNLKRVRVLVSRKPVKSSVNVYIPLLDENPNEKIVEEESWEDEVFRKTKDFNKMTRERPLDESVWLAFAEFQDKVASMQPHKGVRLQTFEKKISILEKATEFNPGSEDLLLSIMNAYQRRDSTEVLIRRWEKILTSNSGSYKL